MYTDFRYSDSLCFHSTNHVKLDAYKLVKFSSDRTIRYLYAGKKSCSVHRTLEDFSGTAPNLMASWLLSPVDFWCSPSRTFLRAISWALSGQMGWFGRFLELWHFRYGVRVTLSIVHCHRIKRRFFVFTPRSSYTTDMLQAPCQCQPDPVKIIGWIEVASNQASWAA